MTCFWILLLSLFSISCAALGFDSYDLMNSLLSGEEIPRILNTDDIPNLRPKDPQPLLSPQADFDGDGTIDIAISGVYSLPKSSKPYFLLVGTQRRNPARFERLFYEEYERPVFLHNPGTTGDGDPGDQAFSASFCWDCDRGVDYYWNKEKRGFDIRYWVPQTRKTQTFTLASSTVPEETADKALKIVGSLKDVKEFTEKLKKEGRLLGVRVEQTTASRSKDVCKVILFEKVEGSEIPYDTFEVNVSKMKVVKRKNR